MNPKIKIKKILLLQTPIPLFRSKSSYSFNYYNTKTCNGRNTVRNIANINFKNHRQDEPSSIKPFRFTKGNYTFCALIIDSKGFT